MRVICCLMFHRDTRNGMCPQKIFVNLPSKNNCKCSLLAAGLETPGAPRLQIAGQSLQAAVASQAAMIRQGGGLGGPALIMSPRLQGALQVPTTQGIINGGPPPLINPADTQGLLYAQYGIADYSTYASLTSPLLADYQAHADAAGGLFAR